MFVTRVLNAIKSKYVLVEIESTVTGFKKEIARERKADKLEVIDFDPLLRQDVVFKEIKKLKGIEKVKDAEWKLQNRVIRPSWALRVHKGRITSSD